MEKEKERIGVGGAGGNGRRGEVRKEEQRRNTGEIEAIYKRIFSPRNGGTALKAWAILWTPPSRLPLH